MMTYLKHVGGKKHSELKTKTFEEIQVLYERLKRQDQNFVVIGSAKDERQIKELNKDPEKKRLKMRVVNETPRKEDTAKVHAEQEVTEKGRKKRKSGHVKMIARKRPRPQPDDDSDDEHRKCLRMVTFEGTIDSEIMETKSFIARLHKVSSPDRITLGDLKIMMESSTEENDQELKDGTVIYMLVERRYPLSKELLQQMIDLGLEVEEESIVALQLWVINSLVHSLCVLSTLRRSGLRTASIAAKPCQGVSLKFYLITGKPNQIWGSTTIDIPSSSSLVMTGYPDYSRTTRLQGLWGYGNYQLGNIIISRVYYIEGLGHNLFSVGQFCDADLEVAFWKNTCFIRNLEGVDLLSGSRDINLYPISLDDMLKSSSICLLSKASKTKSWLWHLRLSHLNFDNGTEFVNQTLHEWYENVGITHQTSIARTPQQNGVVERQNRTLVEAA
ncbi:integrase, catalytic region, zinc finger, CCHC-type containing protein [Tanacetum coccineum]|uniref:Integrase, catalytic region, zinc finger, CCHC-type containing protein n=1 Tax=Tanacetum coccineum TaxID=301880 RepID=A0ABQ5CB41_9ASTR